MADPFVAEIRIFPFNFPPTGWAFCDGQLLPISQNTALFSLVGTYYGGDGKSTFGLPDLQGSAPVQQDGWDQYPVGASSGSRYITLLTSEIPTHTHSLRASIEVGDNRLPNPNVALATSVGAFAYVNGGANPPLAPMAAQSLPPAGSSLPHNNMMPYLTLNFCIAMQGVFPPRG